MSRPRLTFLVSCVLAVCTPAFAFPPVAPESAGFAPERLAHLDRAVQDAVDANEIAGVVTLIVRDGKQVHFSAQGLFDRERGIPMREDAIFRIASMSKAVTSVAAMMLYEEGRLLMNDSVSKYIPGFAKQSVAVAAPEGNPEGVKYTLVKAKRDITIRDLLTHTAGLTYGDGPAKELYKQAGLVGWYFADKDETLAQVIDRLATLPLHGQPGETFQYGYGTDVLGRVIEVVSGKPLDQFFSERIFQPLGMVDTAFFVDPAKADRLMPVYGIQDGKLTVLETSAKSDYVQGPRKCFSGGAGLTSTAADYGRFLEMLVNEGVFEGKRLLSPATVRYMTVNHIGNLPTWDTHRFGLGFWLNEDPGSGAEMVPPGSYGWSSAYYPQYLVDPKHRMFAIFLTQLRPPGKLTLAQRFRVLVTQSLTD